MEKYTNFKKKYGQNFLTDKNLLSAIVRDAGVTENDDVLEIGAGEGALTLALSETAKKVVSYEIDTELKSFLDEKFKNKSNVNIIFSDALKTDINKIEHDFANSYKLVANIPYYITTPLIFKFLETASKITSMTLMVQKEVAERICAKPDTEEYGALSAICQNFCDCKIMRIVNKKMFKPVPKVDSAIINLKIIKKFDKNYADIVRMAFVMRRKTLYNNLHKGLNLQSEKLIKIFNECNFDLKVRAEDLSCGQFECLLNAINSTK